MVAPTWTPVAGQNSHLELLRCVGPDDIVPGSVDITLARSATRIQSPG
jgi:hypothetical protein